MAHILGQTKINYKKKIYVSTVFMLVYGKEGLNWMFTLDKTYKSISTYYAVRKVNFCNSANENSHLNLEIYISFLF